MKKEQRLSQIYLENESQLGPVGNLPSISSTFTRAFFVQNFGAKT